MWVWLGVGVAAYAVLMAAVIVVLRAAKARNAAERAADAEGGLPPDEEPGPDADPDHGPDAEPDDGGTPNPPDQATEASTRVASHPRPAPDGSSDPC